MATLMGREVKMMGMGVGGGGRGKGRRGNAGRGDKIIKGEGARKDE